MNTRTSKTCVRLFPAEYSYSASGADSTKCLLASVDVKNPHANLNDLENSVPPEESNDDLLDQAWDDHTGASLDRKKVNDARQLEMEYYDKMHVFDEVPIAQCWTGQARRT